MSRLEERGEEQARDLREALEALELPPAGARAMVAHLRRFCERHGGRRHYASLLDLAADCEALLEPEASRGGASRGGAGRDGGGGEP